MLLARALNISYRTLVSEYWKRPGRPENHSEGSARYEIEAYRQWIQSFKSAHNFGRQSTKRIASDTNAMNEHAPGPVIYKPNEREQALIDKNRISAERERFKLQVEMAEYVPRMVANRIIDTGNRIVRNELTKAFQSELPPRLEGLKAYEIRKVLMDKLRHITDHLPGSIKRVYEGNGNGNRA